MSSNESLSSYVTANENFPLMRITNDKHSITHLQTLLFSILGLTSLVGWNTWITAKSYFESRLKFSPFADNFSNFFSLGYMAFYMIGLW